MSARRVAPFTRWTRSTAITRRARLAVHLDARYRDARRRRGDGGRSSKVGKKRGRPPNSVKFAQQAANQGCRAGDGVAGGERARRPRRLLPLIDERDPAHLAAARPSGCASAAMTQRRLERGAGPRGASPLDARARLFAIEQLFAPACGGPSERAAIAELAPPEGAGARIRRRGGRRRLLASTPRRAGAQAARPPHARSVRRADPALANRVGLGAGLGPGVSARSVSRTGRCDWTPEPPVSDRGAVTKTMGQRAPSFVSVAHAIEMSRRRRRRCMGRMASRRSRAGFCRVCGSAGMQGMQGGCRGCRARAGVPTQYSNEMLEDAPQTGDAPWM